MATIFGSATFAFVEYRIFSLAVFEDQTNSRYLQPHYFTYEPIPKFPCSMLLKMTVILLPKATCR